MPRKSRSRCFSRPKTHQVKVRNTDQEEPHFPEAQATDSIESQLEQSSPAPVNASEETATMFALDTSPATEVEVPNPSAAVLSAVLRKLSSQLPQDWIATANSKGVYVLLLTSGDVKAVQRQLFVSFLGIASVHVQHHSCPLFEEVFSLTHSPKVFSLDSLDEFCQSVLSLLEIVMQYTNCVGLNYQDVQKVREDYPDVCFDSHPFIDPDCRDRCRSKSCALIVPRESDDARCEACLNVLQWLKDRSDEC